MRVLFARSPSSEETSQTILLFKQIDVNNIGRISKDDIKKYLEQFNIKLTQNNLDILAEIFLERCEVSSDGFVTFKQFAHYVHEQDRHLSPIYAEMDRNMTGKVDIMDVQAYFLKLGIPIEPSEAKYLLRLVNRNDHDCIVYSEWRKFLLFLPLYDRSWSVSQFWRHGMVLDMSVDPVVSIPQFMKHEHTLRRDLLQLFAGGTAGVISRTCTAPIDRLKVMRQVYGYKHKHSGFIQAYRYMIREGGLWSLWRGNLINAVKIAPETAAKYTTYERYKRLLLDLDDDGFFDQHPMATKFVAGSLAGVTAQTVVYPVEVLKTRMCLRKTGQYSSVAACARQIYSELGVRGFFRGFGVNLVGIIPYAGIELATYEYFKSLYIHRYMSHILHLSPRVFPDSSSTSLYIHPPSHIIPFIAATSSALGIVATYPMALIRAKMQAAFYWKQPIFGESVPHPPLTLPSLLRAIWRDDGPRGFYRGMGTNLVKVLPATAISMLAYETIRREVKLGPMGSG